MTKEEEKELRFNGGLVVVVIFFISFSFNYSLVFSMEIQHLALFLLPLFAAIWVFILAADATDIVVDYKTRKMKFKKMMEGMGAGYLICAFVSLFWWFQSPEQGRHEALFASCLFSSYITSLARKIVAKSKL